MPKSKVDPDMEKFQADLLQSVREYKAGKFAGKTKVAPTNAPQRLKKPSGVAQTLLRKAARTPEKD